MTLNKRLGVENAVIIGGTGMLGIATRHIAAEAKSTVILARKPEALAIETGAISIRADWRNHAAMEQAIRGIKAQTIDLLVTWLHDDGLWCLALLEGLLRKGGRSIRVHSSAVGDPAGGIVTDPEPLARIIRQNIVLGWMAADNGRRWLNDAEISGGVI